MKKKKLNQNNKLLSYLLYNPFRKIFIIIIYNFMTKKDYSTNSNFMQSKKILITIIKINFK